MLSFRLQIVVVKVRGAQVLFVNFHVGRDLPPIVLVNVKHLM